MKPEILKVTIGNPIGSLYRHNLVLILIVDKDGNFILGKKDQFYPNHIARMIGGGKNPDENPLFAAQREIKEELQLDIPEDALSPLCTIVTQADTSEGYKELTVDIFSVHILTSSNIKASDDISSIQTYTPEEYSKLVKDMEEMSGEFRTDKFSFNWEDWGKIYAPIHRITMEKYLTK